MDPQECIKAFGPAVGAVCERAMLLGWSATAGAGWLSTLAAVIAGFIFAAIVMVLTPQPGRPDRHGRTVEVGDSLPVLLGAFLSLLVASLLLVLVGSQFHPLRIGPAASVAIAVFAVGAVQTFVAIAWLFVVSPRTAGAFGSVKLVMRFVMFASGLLVHTTVWKGYLISSGDEWGRGDMALSIALLAGPWMLSRAIVGPRSMVERFNGRFQAFSTRCSVALLGGAVVTMVYVLDRQTLTPADAFPAWMARAILLSVGLLFALYDMNLPPLRTSGHDQPLLESVLTEPASAPVSVSVSV